MRVILNLCSHYLINCSILLLYQSALSFNRKWITFKRFNFSESVFCWKTRSLLTFVSFDDKFHEMKT